MPTNQRRMSLDDDLRAFANGVVARQANAQRLRDLMRREGLTSRDVAELVGVHPVTVRKWMCGESRVPQAVLMVLDQTSRSRTK